MNREEKIANSVAAGWTANVWSANYVRNISSRSSWMQHGAKEADRMVAGLIRDLSSPIEMDRMADVVTNVRSLKATLGSLIDAVASLQIVTRELANNLESEIIKGEQG